MGKFHKGIPERIALDLKDRYNLRYFVETGTHIGRTALWASKYFEKVYTIEQDLIWYKKARRYCSGVSNLAIIHAKSQDVLLSVLAQIPRPALIWLDAHWSRDLGYNKCECVNPVMLEIQQIRTDQRGHVIMVDDARLFGKEQGWAATPEVLTALWYDDRNVMVLEDVFISMPCQQ